MNIKIQRHTFIKELTKERPKSIRNYHFYVLYFNDNLNKNIWIKKCVLYLTMYMSYYKVESHNLKRTKQAWPHTVFDKIQMDLD